MLRQETQAHVSFTASAELVYGKEVADEWLMGVMTGHRSAGQQATHACGRKRDAQAGAFFPVGS